MKRLTYMIIQVVEDQETRLNAEEDQQIINEVQRNSLANVVKVYDAVRSQAGLSQGAL